MAYGNNAGYGTMVRYGGKVNTGDNPGMQAYSRAMKAVSDRKSYGGSGDSYLDSAQRGRFDHRQRQYGEDQDRAYIGTVDNHRYGMSRYDSRNEERDRRRYALLMGQDDFYSMRN